VPYKPRMTSSTRLFSRELDVLAQSPELSFLSIVRNCERTFQMLAKTNRWLRKGPKLIPTCWRVAKAWGCEEFLAVGQASCSERVCSG